MSCKCCGANLNSGMIHKKEPTTGQKFKSCPHCSAENGKEHVFHPYPAKYGSTSARITKKNPDGYQSYCMDCRALKRGAPSNAYNSGTLCTNLV